MIHLIWSILNLIIYLYFIYLIVGFITKEKQFYKPQFKVIAIFILVIGIVQIISASNKVKSTNLITINSDYNKKNNSKIEKLKLEDNWTFDINMLVKYSISQNEYIPIESNTFLTGFVSGYVWEFKSIKTNSYNPNEKTKFVATGILKWNLFGITVYNESKTFSGIIK